MATQKQIEYVLENLQGMHSAAFFKNLSEGNAGIHAVLRILYESDDNITAGNISGLYECQYCKSCCTFKENVGKGAYN